MLLPTLAVIAVLLVAAFGARTYTAHASFIPQASQSSQSQISSLAARFGVDVGGGSSSTQSPAVYKTLLESDELLGRVASSDFAITEAGSRRTSQLARLLDIHEPTAAVERYKVITALKDMSSIDVSTLTGIVDIKVRAEVETLSVQIVRRMIDLVNEFNQRKRQEQATAERAFMQSRLDDARGDLRVAENALQSFLQRNRQYQGDPELAFAYDRLRRDLDMKQGMFTTLAQAYEQATIDAARDTPVITIIQPPIVDPVPDGRRLLIKLILAFLVGLAISAIGAAVLDGISMARYRYPTDFAHFQQLRQQFIADVSRLTHRRSRSVPTKNGT